MLKFGIISEVDASTGRARVEFAEDGIVSALLPVSQPGAQDNQYFAAPDIGEQVWCMMDARAENGVIGGAVYNKEDTPPGEAGPDIAGVKFKDGTVITYDRANSKLQVKIGASEFNITEAGYTVKKDAETLKKILSELLDALAAETHPTPSGPSGPPNNKASYDAIKSRLSGLFEE